MHGVKTPEQKKCQNVRFFFFVLSVLAQKRVKTPERKNCKKKRSGLKFGRFGTLSANAFRAFWLVALKNDNSKKNIYLVTVPADPFVEFDNPSGDDILLVNGYIFDEFCNGLHGECLALI